MRCRQVNVQLLAKSAVGTQLEQHSTDANVRLFAPKECACVCYLLSGPTTCRNNKLALYLTAKPSKMLRQLRRGDELRVKMYVVSLVDWLSLVDADIMHCHSPRVSSDVCMHTVYMWRLCCVVVTGAHRWRYVSRRMCHVCQPARGAVLSRPAIWTARHLPRIGAWHDCRHCSHHCNLHQALKISFLQLILIVHSSTFIETSRCNVLHTAITIHCVTLSLKLTFSENLFLHLFHHSLFLCRTTVHTVITGFSCTSDFMFMFLFLSLWNWVLVTSLSLVNFSAYASFRLIDRLI